MADEFFQEMVDDSQRQLEEVDADLITLSQSHENANDIFQNVFRKIHTIKGNSSFYALNNITKLCHEFENLLDNLNSEIILYTEELHSTCMAVTKKLHDMFSDVENQRDYSIDDEIKQINAIAKSHTNSEEEVYYLIYMSTATRDMYADELVELLSKARKHNETVDISGCLIYRYPLFVQVLEGPEDSVKALSQKIKNDPRHKSFKVLNEGIADKRIFEDWSMGFKHMKFLDKAGIKGLNAELLPDQLKSIQGQHLNENVQKLFKFISISE